MQIKIIEPHKSSMGIDAKIISIIMNVIIAVALVFLSGIVLVVPIIFFFIERRSKFVKYQAVLAFIIVVIRIAIIQVMSFPIVILVTIMQAWILLILFNVIIIVVTTIVYIYIIYLTYNYKQLYISQIEAFVNKISK